MTVGRITFGNSSGPWTADETRHGYDRVIRSVTRDPIALVQIAGWDKRSATVHANLIAAAPELLAALKLLMANPEEQDAHNAAYAAIAKAEGKA